MKKIIFTLATLFLLSSCSKDDPATASPTEDQGISALKIYQDNDTKPIKEIIVDKDNKIKSLLYYNTPTLTWGTSANNYTYTGNLITQYSYVTTNNIKYNVDIKYLNDGRISKVTTTKNNVIISVITYNYNDTTGKMTSLTEVFENGVVTFKLDTEYEYSNGNLITAITKDGKTITTQKYEYDTNTTNSKNVYSNIVGFDKLIFDTEISNKNPYIKGTVTVQDPITLMITQKSNYRQVITYNQNLFPTKIESSYSTDSNPLISTGFERIEYK